MTGDDDAWFATKRFGWGYAPVRWQGWLLTAAFAAIVIALARLDLHPDWLGPVLVVLLTIGFIAIAAHNSRNRKQGEGR